VAEIIRLSAYRRRWHRQHIRDAREALRLAYYELDDLSKRAEERASQLSELLASIPTHASLADETAQLALAFLDISIMADGGDPRARRARRCRELAGY
jgi:hypothetical protein